MSRLFLRTRSALFNPQNMIAARVDEPASISTARVRHPLARITFRFVFAYLVLYNFPFPFSAIPGLQVVAGWYGRLWQVIVPWFGARVLGLATPISIFTNGSGDTTYDWVLILCYLLVSAFAALVWTALDRRRSDYRRLHAWLRIYVRFSLATAMLGYGAFKVIKAQFPDLSLDQLVEPFGQASPMGLLWKLMGFSPGYNLFTGASEMIAGFLLCTRRTATLGALICIGVMGNVVAMNFSFDVPVKLYSSHLCAMAFFIAAADLRRLADFFVFNRKVEPVEHAPLFERVWLRRAAVVVQVLFVVLVTAMPLYFARLRSMPAASPFRGIWSVDELELNGETKPPVITDEERLRLIVFDDSDVLDVQRMNDRRDRYLVEMNTETKTLTLKKRLEPDEKGKLLFDRPAPDRMTLEGMFEGQKFRAGLRRVERNFVLTTRGFHWISEYPFNR
jgi:hypothetical protein